MSLFRVGIDSYCLNPRRLDPFTILDWVATNGGEGVQFSEVHMKDGTALDKEFLHDLANAARERDLYLEWGGGQHIPFDLKTWKKKDISGINKKIAEQAALLDTSIVRSCSGGLMR